MHEKTDVVALTKDKLTHCSRRLFCNAIHSAIGFSFFNIKDTAAGNSLLADVEDFRSNIGINNLKYDAACHLNNNTIYNKTSLFRNINNNINIAQVRRTGEQLFYCTITEQLQYMDLYPVITVWARAGFLASNSKQITRSCIAALKIWIKLISARLIYSFVGVYCEAWKRPGAIYGLKTAASNVSKLFKFLWKPKGCVIFYLFVFRVHSLRHFFYTLISPRVFISALMALF